MQDYDWIQIAYLFSKEPSAESYELMFEVLSDCQKNGTDSERFDITYWNNDGTRHDTVAETSEIPRILLDYPTISVKVDMGWDEISIGLSKQNTGIPSYTSTPYLRFTTWIYALKDPKENNYLDDVKQFRREFVTVHSRVASVLEPEWGFGRRGGLAIGDDQTIEELIDQQVPPLYEYNVFSEETVEAIGRERVLSASAYYVEELDSGGVFLAVREPPTQCSHVAEPCLEVADHLGLSLATPERYH